MVFIDKKNFPQSNVWRVSKYGIDRRGYSILELMVVIALVSIISALSIPSFLQWRQETELKHVLRTVAEMAHNARVYAMTSNTPTHLYIGMLDNSCVLVSTDKNCSCITSANCHIEGTSWKANFGGLTTAISYSNVAKKELKKHSITFSPLGTTHFGSNTRLRVSNAPLSATITFSILGRVKTCTATSMTGFATC